MVFVVQRVIFLFVALVVVCGAFPVDFNADSTHINEETLKLLPYLANEEDIRRIHSMLDAYRADVMGGQRVIEMAADSKYRPWKRNGDLINTLLGLPKDMYDAGR